MDTGSIYVEWLRPEQYGKHVDTYTVYYRRTSQPREDFQLRIVKANPEDVKSKVRGKATI